MRTTPVFWVGLALIIVGLAIIFMGGIPYREKSSAQLGPVNIQVQEEKRHRVPPLVSFGIVALGGVLMLAGTRPK
jgi:hypothetical protein